MKHQSLGCYYRSLVSVSLLLCCTIDVITNVRGFQSRVPIPFHPHKSWDDSDRSIIHRRSRRQSEAGSILLYAQSSDQIRERAPNGSTNDDDDEEEEQENFSQLLCAIDFRDISAPFISRLDSESVFVDFSKDGTVIPAGRVGQLKEDTANFLREPVIEILVAIAVLINSALVALSTLDRLAPYMDLIRFAEDVVSLLFCVDFAGRWFSSNKDRWKHIFDAQFALDVLVVIFPLAISLAPPTILEEALPSSITNPSGLFNLELLRVLRLRRVLQDLATFDKFLGRALGVLGIRNVNSVQEWELQLGRVLLSLFTLLSVATGLIYTAEQPVNPDINNYFDALYFGLTTLTTVGFGDVTPVTWEGKLVVGGSILVGVAVVPAQAASLVEALLARDEENKLGGGGGGRLEYPSSLRRRRRQQQQQPNGNREGHDDNSAFTLDVTTVCSNCGATFHWTKAQYCHSCGEPLE